MSYSQTAYSNNLEIGKRYEDFICERLGREGFIIQNFTSIQWQLQGENRQGLEIKFDSVMATSGRLFIEESEKSYGDWADFKPSGIWKDDNSWLYGIGNYERFLIFGKRTLQQISEWAHNDPRFAKDWGISFEEIESSKGMLFNEYKARSWVLKVYEFGELAQ